MENSLLLTAWVFGRAIALAGDVLLIFTLIRALRWDGPVTKALAWYVAGAAFTVAWNLSGSLLPGVTWHRTAVEYVWIPQIVRIVVIGNLLRAINGWPWNGPLKHVAMPPGEARGEKGNGIT